MLLATTMKGERVVGMWVWVSNKNEQNSTPVEI